ncbi:hypothetical protein BC829DRAFT_407834 [Chytridium lagenaria]|nr:hypothetical protein BC829DRAFT_407834 [Chytridium lagenaria]
MPTFLRMASWVATAAVLFVAIAGSVDAQDTCNTQFMTVFDSDPFDIMGFDIELPPPRAPGGFCDCARQCESNNLCNVPTLPVYGFTGAIGTALNGLLSQSVLSETVCIRQCQADSACRYVIYSAVGGVCSLYSGSANPDRRVGIRGRNPNVVTSTETSSTSTSTSATTLPPTTTVSATSITTTTSTSTTSSLSTPSALLPQLPRQLLPPKPLVLFKKLKKTRVLSLVLELLAQSLAFFSLLICGCWRCFGLWSCGSNGVAGRESAAAMAPPTPVTNGALKQQVASTVPPSTVSTAGYDSSYGYYTPGQNGTMGYSQAYANPYANPYGGFYAQPQQPQAFTVEQYLQSGWTMEQINALQPPIIPSGIPQPN